MLNKILLSVISVLTVLLMGYIVKSKIDNTRLENEQEKVEELEVVNTLAPLNLDVSVIAAKAQGEIAQIDKEVIDENVTYDVGSFYYRFD